MSETKEERWHDDTAAPTGIVSNFEETWATADYLNALEQERDELRKKWNDFMEWLTDQQIVHWTLTEETKDNPKAAVESLLQTFLQEINDPRISQVAAKAALADEMRHKKHMSGDWEAFGQFLVDWASRYDSLIQEGK